uniref:DNA binding protein n=1 Tax=Amorphochlora amoebiformis TaxID=1561963 RepID=A0A0H5BIS0_9EUKA|nr:DNA binding protein [Amorphochlora amoebiformis]|mmetsp:Transcript_32231/g.51915  ORF Transcript_32231/g.51915 Transcript_32231/m.51915 type:complete len:84 (-) Transcript_32231:410-661(-)
MKKKSIIAISLQYYKTIKHLTTLQACKKLRRLCKKNFHVKYVKITSLHQKAKIFLDFEPLLCKDYKIYGRCSYGQTCKFSHIR